MHSFPKQTHSIGNTKLWWGKSVPPLRAYQNKNMKKRNKNRKKPNGLKQTVFEAGLELFPAHPPKLWTIGKCDSKQKKKEKNVKTCARKIKKKSQCDTNWLHPSFSRKKKVEQNKNKTSKKNSHPDQFLLWQFAMAASCFGSAYCLHIGKNPVCVRSKKNETRAWKKRKRM